MSTLVVTHLFPALPQARITELEAALRAETGAAADSGGLDLRLTAHDFPLGGEAFTGTIPQTTTPANRAALLGIVSRHGAHMELSIDLPDARDTTRRQALRLALRASQALARRHPPLALLWHPTSRLMQRAALEALGPEEEPLALFILAKDEVTGPRRVPSLVFDGAPTWIGQQLHARLGVLPREVVRSAGFAFLTAARQSPELIQAQSFHHAGHSYRLAHAPEANRIDLIPAAEAPLQIRPLPRTGSRPVSPRSPDAGSA